MTPRTVFLYVCVSELFVLIRIRGLFGDRKHWRYLTHVALAHSQRHLPCISCLITLPRSDVVIIGGHGSIQTSQGFPFQTETELHHTTSLNGNWAEIKILHQNKKKLLRFVCLFAKRFSLYESAHISFQQPMTCLTDFNPSDDPIIPDSYWLLVTQQTEHW